MSDILIYHLRPTEDQLERASNNGTTIALKEEGHGFRIAFAACHLKDQFCRRTGRVKACGRLNSPSQSQVINIPNCVTIKTVEGRKAAIEWIKERFSYVYA